MVLTTEQKINMLTLAGYAPYLRGGDKSFPRICTGLPAPVYDARAQHDVNCLWRDYGTGSNGAYRFIVGYVVGVPDTWDSMRVEDIPDELIMEACNVR